MATESSETVSPQDKKLLKNASADFFCDYGVAYTYVSSASESHSNQWELAEAIEQHIEGKKPMSQKRLDELGMSWAYNYNYYQATGKIQSATSQFVEKMLKSISLGYPQFRNEKEEDMKDESLAFLADYNERGIVSAAIGCALAEMLEVEGDIQSFLNRTEYISYTFGYCAVCWTEDDWKPDPIHVRHLATRPGSTIEQLNEWVVFKSETANWLWERYTDIKDKEVDEEGYVDGWNKEALELTLARLYTGKIDPPEGGNPRRAEIWPEVMPLYEASTSQVLANSSDVQLAKIYYKETDGKYTECYIPWGFEWCKPTLDKMTNTMVHIAKILFKDKHTVDNSKELAGFIRDSGFTVNGEISKMKGAGRLIVENSQRYNRTRNSTNNKSLFSGSPWFETANTQTNEKFKVTFSQGFVMMPAGSMIADRQPTFNLTENIALLQFEEREFAGNSEHFDPSITNKLSSRPTSDEIAVASAEAGRSRGAKDAVKVSDYAKIFLQFIKKMARPPDSGDHNFLGHRLFFDLMQRYLPQYALDDAATVKILKSVRSYAISLVLGDIQAIQVAIGMAETPFGRNRYRRMLLIAMGHARSEVDILVPLYTDKYRFMQDDRIAAIENDMFWNGNEIIFQLTDDHIVHFDSHHAKFRKTIEAVRAGRLDIIQAWKYCGNLFAHEQLHIDPLIKDASLKSEGEKRLQMLKEDDQLLKQLDYAAQKEAKNRADQQAQIPSLTPKDAADIKREDEKAAANASRQDRKAQTRAIQDEQKQAHDQALAERKLESEIQLKTIETVAKTTMP